MLINYFTHPDRESAFNVRIARVIIGVYAIWKTASFEWFEVYASPLTPFDTYYGVFFPPQDWQFLIPIEAGMLLASLGFFTLNYRKSFTGWTSAALMAHLSGLLYSISRLSGANTFLPLVFCLIFISMYNETDMKNLSANRSYRLEPLKLILIFLGVYYFSSGVGKFLNSNIMSWISTSNFRRILSLGFQLGVREPLAYYVLEFSVIVQGAMATAVLIQLMLLPAIFVSERAVSVLLSLIALMHILIFVFVGINFLENLIIFSLFLPWNRILPPLKKRVMTGLYDVAGH